MSLNLPKDEVVARYVGGETYAQIAAHYGCSLSAIRDTVPKEYRRKRGAPTGPKDAERLETFRRMRREGMTLQAIANEFGITRQGVEQYLAKHS